MKARAGALLLLLTAACSGPPPIRYFRPQGAERPSRARPVVLADDGTVRLAPVTGAVALRDRIMWRRSDVELGYYENERWTEPPAGYLARAVTRELFEVRRVPRGGRMAPLEAVVTLTAFEEVLLPKHSARVAISVSLVDTAAQRSLLERTVEAVEPVAAETSEAMARAMSSAFDRAVVAACDAIERRLPKKATQRR